MADGRAGTEDGMEAEHPDEERLPGATATEPSDSPAGGWKQILLRTKDEIKADRVGLMAAGVAFYAMLAIVPTLIAAITLWGLVSQPAQIEQTVATWSNALPESAAQLISEQVGRIAATSSRTLGWALLASLLGALWAASSGTKGLMNAVTAAYNEDETRGFLRVRGIALALTIGAIFFALITMGLIAVVPVVLGDLGLGQIGQTLIRWGRWPILAIAVVLGLAVIYRYAPDRDEPRWTWMSTGSVVATIIWLIASGGFAWYVNSFGSYAETYGSLAGVIVLMLWFFLTAFAILIGAELDAQLEHQTRRDTTRGEPQPIGRRDADVAEPRPDRSSSWHRLGRGGGPSGTASRG
ncbi:MAG: YihY/virulence factor BrkB family protein [Actinobacteria bacterium]|nr:YihY/virulence factor BrkB family protein [Actinomycetota bacterium]